MPARTLTVLEHQVNDLIAHRAMTAHDVAARLNLPPKRARGLLVRLEGRGLAEYLDGRWSRA